MSQPISVVVPVYDGVTQLDFTGPHQFLSRTPDLHVRVASLGGEPVSADRLTFSNLDDLAAIESSRFEKRSEEHTSELQSLAYLVCRLLLEKKKNKITVSSI